MPIKVNMIRINGIVQDSNGATCWGGGHFAVYVSGKVLKSRMCSELLQYRMIIYIVQLKIGKNSF